MSGSLQASPTSPWFLEGWEQSTGHTPCWSPVRAHGGSTLWVGEAADPAQRNWQDWQLFMLPVLAYVLVISAVLGQAQDTG